jgi:hypothetical protein
MPRLRRLPAVDSHPINSADLAINDGLDLDKLSPSFRDQCQAPRLKLPQRAIRLPLPGHHRPLKEVFDEFCAELGEMGAEEEDLETPLQPGNRVP